MGLDLRTLRLAQGNDDVITRAMLIAEGYPPGFLATQVRRGLWQSPYPGVAVIHTGPMPWLTRARTAVEYCGAGAALSHTAAGYKWRIIRSEPQIVEVSVPWERRVAPQPGLRVHLRRRMPMNYGSPRATHETDTVLDLWQRETDLDAAIALLAAAVRAHVSTRRLARDASARPRVARRRLLLELLGEVAAGVESPMEHRYRQLERRHGLPRSTLQKPDRVGGKSIRSDVAYEEYCVRVELDGSLAHPGGRTAADTWRDNAVLIERGDITLRYRWVHVVAHTCATAAQVAHALQLRGWDGSLRRCGPGCAA